MIAVNVIVIHPRWVSCAFWRRVDQRIAAIAAAKAKAVKP